MAEKAYKEKYDELKCLGRGTYGVAYLVRRRLDSQLFVAKKINLEAATAAEKESTLKEIQVLRTMKHACVVAFEESFDSPEGPIIIMEYAERGSLSEKLDALREADGEGAGIPEAASLDIFCQLLLALEHVHGARVMHRDLKPANVFLGEHDLVKLGDFGIARQFSGTGSMAQTVAGTPYYFAPEVINGKPYDYKADVWSAACLLYECLMGQKAFQGTSLPQVLMAIARNKYIPPPPERCSPALGEVLASMLRADPRERPSIEQLLAVPLLAAARTAFYARMQRLAEAPSPSGRSNSGLAAAQQLFPDVRKLSLSASGGSSSGRDRGPPSLTMRAPQPTAPSWGEKGTGVYSWGTGSRPVNIYQTLTDFADGMGGDMKLRGVYLGAAHVATLTDAGQVFTWCGGQIGGGSEDGQLGHGSKALHKKPKLVEGVLTGQRVVCLALGAAHCLAATSSYKLYAWGNNDESQLGLGTQANALSPVEVPALSGLAIVKLAAGAAHSVALVRGGEGGLYTWGHNDMGQCGHEPDDGGDEERILVPKRLISRGDLGKVAELVDVACGLQHTAAAGGGVCFTFGSNAYGQLGRDRDRDSGGDERQFSRWRVPHRVRGELLRAEEKVDSVACGATHTACLASATGNVYVWGRALAMGKGEGRDWLDPVKLSHEAWDRRQHRPRQVACGDEFTVVLTDPEGACYVMGHGADGRLGKPESKDADRPVLLQADALSDQEIAFVACGPHCPQSLALVQGFSGQFSRYSSLNDPVAQ